MTQELNYYEIEPENNTFTNVYVDITHRCNMECANCYLPARDFNDMDFEKYREFVKRLAVPSNAPGTSCMLRIVGAEPTLHPRVFDFIDTAHEFGHRTILMTNGLRLAKDSFMKKMMDSPCRQIYLSMNGVDNDDWYEKIDNLRCAEKKVKALENIGNNFVLDTGTILMKGINESAIGKQVELLQSKGIKNVSIRLRNVGQLGRYTLESEQNLTLMDIARLASQQLNIPLEYIISFAGKGHRYGGKIECNTLEFPLDIGNTNRYTGYWIKITSWDSNNPSGIPDPNSSVRGRITQDWKIAPFYEHLKANEHGY